MSVVVERGLARCPRCVAVADYAFVESGPNVMRYEVRCRRCGEDYCEVHTPMAPDFTTAVAALEFVPPENPRDTVPFARRTVAWLAHARDRVVATGSSARLPRDWLDRVRRRPRVDSGAE